VCDQNPSDSDLEERITQIIAEEDEEIIRQHCFSYCSPPAASASLTSRPVCDNMNSSSAVDCEASDIDDDELHQLLGVD